MAIKIGDIEQVDITFKQGDTYNLPLKFSDEAGVMNITGWTIIFTIKNDRADADPGLYQQKVTSHTNPTGGISGVSVPANLSRGLPVKNLLFDVQITDALGQVFTQFEGKCIVTKDVSTSTT